MPASAAAQALIAERDQKALRLLAAGLSPAEVRERLGLKPRYIERIVNRAKAAAEIGGKEPSHKEAHP
ncbi:helix-turn-helix domain-containing protein [Mesorhizobium sp. CN2-181]|uniref:helix-turn-helix domain-containing protein n=1 Tax=Mesorhizobium yinganensis TaxID=3157707 RepID=UPI0032B78BA8